MNNTGTVRKFLSDKMEENGLWPDEAEAVIKTIEEDKANITLAQVLDKQIEGYPPMVMSIAWITVCDKAVKYIDEHKPKHFARFMFEK